MLIKLMLIRFVITVVLFSSLYWSRPDEGYLFISSRADEVTFAARRLRKVSPFANITFIADRWTLKDAASQKFLFDLMLASEDIMEDISMHDSMGFRLQKLRGMTKSPYKRTIYMDSDTYICHSIDDLFHILDNVDMAMTWGGRRNHTGASAGVLAYSSTPSSMAVWAAWENIYRLIMHTNRREQPAFQRALAHVTNTIGLRVRKLPQTYNCRNIRKCEPTTILKDGTLDTCKVLHAHSFHVEDEPKIEAMQIAHYDEKCAVYGGTHRLVFFFQPELYRQKNIRSSSIFVKALTALKVDNDFSICDLRTLDDDVTIRSILHRCIMQSNKYAIIAFASFPPNKVNLESLLSSDTKGYGARQYAPVFIALVKHPLQRCEETLRTNDHSELLACLSASAQIKSPSCFERLLGCKDNADVIWFCGASMECMMKLKFDLSGIIEDVKAVINQLFIAIGIDTRRLSSSAEFERVLPSHFLRLTSYLPVEHTRQERINFLVPNIQEAYERANALDYELYEYLTVRLKERQKCHRNTTLKESLDDLVSKPSTLYRMPHRGRQKKYIILPRPP